MKMERMGCSEMSVYKIQTLGNYPEESIQHSEHGESLKSRSDTIFLSDKLCQSGTSFLFQIDAGGNTHKFYQHSNSYNSCI